MRNLKLASLTAGIALAAGLLAGCSTTYNPPQERVAVVTPPPAAAPAAGIVHLQSFAGDVCMSDPDGKNGMVSHCVCQQSNCSCQTTATSCP